MNHRLLAAGRGALLVAAGVALTGCAGSSAQSTADPDSATAGSVDVDTAALRAQKAGTDIAPCPASDGTPAGSDGLPDITLPCLGGGDPVELARLTGSPLVLNLWGQYCGPCRSETPVLQRVHDQLGDAVSFLGVDYQDTVPGAAIAFADDLGVTYPQVADPDAAIKPGLLEQGIAVQGIPVTVFVTAAGDIAYATKGPIHSVDELSSLISEYLGVEIPAGAGS